MRARTISGIFLLLFGHCLLPATLCSQEKETPEAEAKISASVVSTLRTSGVLPMDLLMSPDGRLLYCEAFEGSFNASTGRIQVSMDQANGVIELDSGRSRGRLGDRELIGFASNGDALAEDGGIRIWDYGRNRGGRRLTTVEGRVLVSPGGRYAATVLGRDQVVLTDLESRQQIGEHDIPKVEEAAQEFLLDAQGHLYALALKDGTLTVIDPGAGAELVSFQWKAQAFDEVAISPDGRYLAANNGGTVYAWDLTNGVEMEGGPTLGGVNGLSFSRDGRLVGAVSPGREIMVWDLAGGAFFLSMGEHGGPVTDLVFSPTEDRFVTSSMDGTLKVWQYTWEGDP